MKIQQIRNATIIIEYAGKRFLVDPMLGEKGRLLLFRSLTIRSCATRSTTYLLRQKKLSTT